MTRVSVRAVHGVPNLAPPARHWECLRCPLTHVTHEARPHQPFHQCAGMAGLTVPMVAAGTRAQMIAREREDYVGQEKVTLDGNNRPVMSVTVEYEDRTDVAVYAPCATGSMRDGQ